MPNQDGGGSLGSLSLGVAGLSQRGGGVPGATYTVDTGTDFVTWVGPTPTEGQEIVFNGSVPGGLTPGTTYYMVNVSGNTFQVSATPNGSPINLTTSGGGPAYQTGSTGETYTADDGDDTITTTGPVPPDGSTFVFQPGGNPGGTTPGTTYYVVNSNPGGGTFQLSLTPGGTPINFSSPGGGNGTIGGLGGGNGGSPPDHGLPVSPDFISKDWFVGHASGNIAQYREDGAYVATLTAAAAVRGLTADLSGNIYAAIAATPWIQKFSPTGVSLGGFGDAPYSSTDQPWDIVRMQSGSFLVLVAHDESGTLSLHLWKLSSSGSRTDNWTIASDILDNTFATAPKLDISCAGNTVYYTDQQDQLRKVSSVDGTQLTDFEELAPSDPWVFAGLRIVPTGGLIVAMTRFGHGPRHALTHVDDTSFWTDEIGAPISRARRLYHLKREDGVNISHITSRFDEDVTAMTSYYNPCPVTDAGDGSYVFGVVF